MGCATRRSTRTNATMSARADAEHREARCRQPRPGLAAFEQPQDQQGAAAGDEDRSGEVDLLLARFELLVEVAHDQPGGQQAERDVDREDPAPGVEIGEYAADDRPDHRGDRPHAGQVALGLRPLGEGVHVAGDGDRHRGDGSRAEALDRTEEDEGEHVHGQAAEDRADQEQADPDEHDPLASVDVGETAVDGHGDRLRQQIDREQPGELVEAAEVAHDRRAPRWRGSWPRGRSGPWRSSGRGGPVRARI